MKTTIKLPFNTELPSSLSKERIDELNQMALKAQLNEERSIKDNKVDENCLIIEVCGLQEVYGEVAEVATNKDFYHNIDKAFDLLLEHTPNERKSIFRTYKDLASLFRTIEKQRVFIENRWQETNQILQDVNTLDREDINRRKLVRDV